MRIIGLMTAVALAGAGLIAVDPAMVQAGPQADPNGNMHVAAPRPAAHGAAAPARAGRPLARQHHETVRHRFARRPFRGRRGFFGYGGYPVYVTSGYETGAEVDGYPAETEAPAVSAPVYAPPTLYPAKYYYSPSPGVYFYRPAFERPRKCDCG
jgi:hypothetical protein